MVIVKNSRFSELNDFTKMNKQYHVGNHLNEKSLNKHQQEFKNSNIVYLSVFCNSNYLAGYIILAKGKNTNDIQLKRIVIDENYLGHGQNAIKSMENHCVNVLKINRIWLDVFKDNVKAIHVYKKLGYKVFRQGKENLRTVLYYEKRL